MPRHDLRKHDELREITFQKDFAPHATGSVLCSFGNTRVICAVNIENKVPGWMNYQKVSGGWIAAEYSLLPYSTLDRKPRDIQKGRLDGRTVEIQRLIGRSMRAVIDLQKIHGKTIWIDCDVLQADGGTRTASITGAYLATQLAVHKLLKEEKLKENPFTDSIAAVSVGICDNEAVLDLDFPEDKDASVDFNVVMTGKGQFVELQGTGEEATFSDEELQELLRLGKKGIQDLSEKQAAFLQEHL